MLIRITNVLKFVCLRFCDLLGKKIIVIHYTALLYAARVGYICASKDGENQLWFKSSLRGREGRF
jgi:hypothetical protein